MKAMSQRQERMAEVVRQAVARALVDGSVPFFFASEAADAQRARLTVSDVWISADLRVAKCFVSGAGAHSAEIVDGLNASGKSFRKVLAGRLENKYIPTVRFLADEVGEQALDVFSAVRAQEAGE